jgi:hypothetical protein
MIKIAPGVNDKFVRTACLAQRYSKSPLLIRQIPVSEMLQCGKENAPQNQ